MTRSSRLARIAVPLAVAAVSLAATPRIARAQPVSEADRGAARKLFFEGMDLQSAGRFADALDRFERAQRVVYAPTTLLHIAECHAALGHLVEGAEKYRELGRITVAADAPPAFRQAQEQGRVELQQLEPRVPELKINVTPANVPTLEVRIDDQAMNAALVGEPRPVNPGVHKISASAPGFTKAEQTVEVKERTKNQSVTLALQSTGGVIYAPAGAGAGTSSQLAPGVAGPSGAPPAPGDATGAGGPPPEKPPLYDKPHETYRSRSSVFFGLRLAATGVGFGQTTLTGPTGASITTNALDSAEGSGASIGIEGAYRFARMGYLGLAAEYASYGEKNLVGGTTVKTSSGLIAAKIGLITNPDGFAFMGDLGAGYRSFTIDTTTGAANVSTSAKGGEFEMAAGMHIRAGRWIRIAPLVELDLGKTGEQAITTTVTTPGVGYYILSGVIAGYFDIDLDRKPAPAATTPAQ